MHWFFVQCPTKAPWLPSKVFEKYVHTIFSGSNWRHWIITSMENIRNRFYWVVVPDLHSPWNTSSLLLFLGVKKRRQIISRVLFSWIKHEVYHLSGTNVAISIYRPTLSDRTSSPQAWVYMIFQPVRFTLRPLSPSIRWALTSPFHLFPETKSEVV